MNSLDNLHPLAWDSDFFGFSVGRFDIEGLADATIVKTIDNARLKNYQLIYAIVNPLNTSGISILEKAGAQLVDRKITYSMTLPKSIDKTINSAICKATDFTLGLQRLAWQSAEYSRFKLDKNFKSHIFKRLYSSWLKNSLSGIIARRVFVWRNSENEEIGLITLAEKDKQVYIGLLAVDINTRGHGIGKQLIDAARKQAVDWKYNTLQVVTQGDNIPACLFYEKCGFVSEKVEHIYHLWFK